MVFTPQYFIFWSSHMAQLLKRLAAAFHVHILKNLGWLTVFLNLSAEVVSNESVTQNHTGWLNVKGTDECFVKSAWQDLHEKTSTSHLGLLNLKLKPGDG